MPVTDPAARPAWHALSPGEVLSTLGVDAASGLSREEVTRRREIHGLNVLVEPEHTSPWRLLLGQFANILILILLVAVVLSAVLGHVLEAAAIAAIVLFAVLLGFVQEFRAGRAIEALRRMAAPHARVKRGGREEEISAAELVPGDILLLVAGDRLAADARLLEATSLHVDEAALTGESTPVEKSPAAVAGESLAVADRRSMVYAGTAVTIGRGNAAVVETGMTTEFGKIAGLLETVETGATPLQKNLDRVGKWLAAAALVLVLAVSALGIFRGQPVLEMLVFGIALAVAVVPEALPAVVTISLAMGVRRMVKRRALMRRLPAVETLGSTTVICSDNEERIPTRLHTTKSQWRACSGSAKSGRRLQFATDVQNFSLHAVNHRHRLLAQLTQRHPARHSDATLTIEDARLESATRVATHPGPCARRSPAQAVK